MKYLNLLILLLLNCFTAVSYANIINNKTQNFNPTSNVQDFVTVRSSKTLGTNKFSLGLFVNNATNSLSYFKSKDNTYEDTIPKKEYLNDMLLFSEFTAGYGLTSDIDLELNIPILLYQYLNEKDSLHGEFDSKGIIGIKTNIKYNLLKKSNYGLAAIGTIYADTIKNNPYNNENSKNSYIYNIELAGDLHISDLELALNLGYKILSLAKNKQEDSLAYQNIKPNKTEFISSIAVAYMLTEWKTKLITEIFGAFPTSKYQDTSNRSKNSIEAIGGLKYFSQNNLIYHTGFGTEMLHGIATPDWRIYLGIHWINDINLKKPKEIQISKKPIRKQKPKVSKQASNDLPPITMQKSANIKINYEKPDETIVWKDVLFKFDSDEFINKQEAAESLKNIFKTIIKNPTFKKIVIEGHTCNIGSDKYNLMLSKRRAQKIRNLLIKKMNINPAKIIIKGYGETKPIAPNTSEYGRIKNRRVEFKIYR